MPYNGEQVTCYFGDMSLKCNYAIGYLCSKFNKYDVDKIRIIQNRISYFYKHLLRKGGGCAQLEPKFHRTKLEKSCLFFKLLDLTALVSDKINSVYCQVLDILGQICQFLLFNQPKTD